MENETKLAACAMVALGVATAALVVMPYVEVRDVKPLPELKPYTSAQLRGRDRRGRAKEQIAGGGRLGEGDHLANVAGARKKRHEPRHAQGDPAVRRRAKLKGVQ